MQACNNILFADDTTIYYSHENISSLSEILEKYLVNLSNWFKASKVSLNISKTNLIYFSRIYVVNYDALIHYIINYNGWYQVEAS